MPWAAQVPIKCFAVQVQSTGELFKLWREGKVPLLMVAYSWMLGQVGDALGVQPGEEFRVALVEAQKVGDFYVCDRHCAGTPAAHRRDCCHACCMEEQGSLLVRSAQPGA